MATGEHILGRKMLVKEEPKRKRKKYFFFFYGQEAIRNSSCLEFTVESDGG